MSTRRWETLERDPDLVDEATGYRTWMLPDLPGFIGECGTQRRITLDIATHITGEIIERCLDAQGPPITVIHNWGRMQGYDTEAQKHLVRWSRENAKLMSRCVIIIPYLPRTTLVAINMVSVVLRAANVPFELKSSLNEVLSSLRISETVVSRR